MIGTSWNESLFAWPYWILLWNLMQRSETVANIQLKDISWTNDCMTIVIPKSKTDQKGEMIYPRHLYANPINPAVCPVLAVAVIIFSKSYLDSSYNDNLSWKLFRGSSQEDRMSKLMGKLMDKINENEEEKKKLGIPPHRCGLHSPRKGVNTYCCSFVGGPDYQSICHRGAWSLGGVLSRYNFPTQGGDQFVGRTVSGLPIHSINFGILPPRFKPSIINSITEREWNMILPLYNRYPPSIRVALPFFLASLVYAEKFLRDTLDPQHSLFYSPIFTTSLISRLRGEDKILIGTSYCNETKINSTGVPPYLSIASSVSSLKDELQNMDRTLPGKLKEEITKNFEVENVLPLTKGDLDVYFKQFTDTFESKMISKISINNNNNNELIEMQEKDPSREIRKIWQWGGRLHPCPENYKLPRVDNKTLWGLWHFPNEQMNIKELKYFHKYDFNINGERTAFIKGSQVMKMLENIAIKEELIPNNKLFNKCNREEMNIIFDKSFQILKQKINQNPHFKWERMGEISYTRMYEYCNKIKDKEVGENRRGKKRKRNYSISTAILIANRVEEE